MNLSIRRSGSFGALLISTLVLAGCMGTGIDPTPTASYVRTDVADRGTSSASAARMISEYRAAYGLGPVTADPRLDAMAQKQARAQASSGTMGHGSLGARVRASGYPTRAFVENVAAGRTFQSVPKVLDVWRNSPAHNANLLKPNVSQIGIGAATSGGRVYWSLVLAKPR